MSTYVNIGRNVDGRPMRRRRWAHFQRDTLLTVEAHCGPAHFDGAGNGRWDDLYEDSYMVISSDPVFGTPALSADLETLAYQYDQEAIALLVAEPTFVGPEV